MPPESRFAPWRDVGLLFFLAMLLLGISAWIGAPGGLLREALAFVPSAWLLLSPWVMARLQHRDPEEWILGRGNPWRSMALALGVSLVVFPVYGGLFLGWSRLVEQRTMVFQMDRLADFPVEVQGRPPLDHGSDALVVFGESGRLTLWNRTARELSVRLTGCEGRAEGLALRDGRVVRSGALDLTDGAVLSPGMGARCLIPTGKASLEAPEGTLLLLGEEGRGEIARGSREVGRSFGWIPLLLWTHLLGIALPEEVFFRGFVQRRIGDAFRRRFRLLGARVGAEVVVASGLFALSHLVLVPAAFRLAVFFPGLLFGWLRERTDSTAGPILLHALSNVLLAILVRLQVP